MSAPEKPRQTAGRPDGSGAVATPMLRVPHLAEAAKRAGTEERVIWVDAPALPQVKTPGRTAGQWLKSGQQLPSSALASHSGNALADAAIRSTEREGMDR